METYTIERTEHSRFVYIPGLKPVYKVGDHIFENDIDEDAASTYDLGCITKVEFDRVADDWVYTFEDGGEYCEEQMLDGTYYKK